MNTRINSQNYNLGEKTNFKIKNTPKNNPTENKEANSSSMEALSMQGRALINMPKLSFRGNFEQTEIEKYKEETDLSEDTIDELMKLSPKQRKEAIDLANEGIIPESYLIDIVKLNDTEIKSKALDLIRKGMSAPVVISLQSEFIKEDEEEIDKENLLKKYQEISDLLDKKLDPVSIGTHIKMGIVLDEKLLKRTEHLLNTMQSSPELAVKNMLNFAFSLEDYIKLEDEEYQNFIALINNGISNFDLAKEMAADDNKCAQAKKLLEEGYDENDIECLIELDEDLAKKVKGLIKKYSIGAYGAKSASQYTGEKFEKAIRLTRLIGDADKDFVNLPDDLFERFIQVAENINTYNEITKLKLSIRKSEDSENGYDYEEFIEIIEEKEKETALKNADWNNFVATIKDSEEYKQLDENDIKFLKDNIFENKFYSPKEYLINFVRLKNLKTPDNESVLSCESFGNKIKENGLGDFASKNKNLFYENAKAILSIDPNSNKAKYIEAILKLIHTGKVNPSALRKLSDMNDLKSLQEMLIGSYYANETRDSSWEISNNLKNDIDLVLKEGVTSQNWIEKYIPTYNSNAEGLKNHQIGDAYVVDGEKYIRIKTNENDSKEVKLTKETYAKLFPPVERFLTTQQIMGNCYCIETLMSMYCNDATRIKLLEVMEEDDNGNIKISFENYKPVILEKGELPKNENSKIYSSGADGYKLLEYAYSCALVEDAIKNAEKNLEAEKLEEFREFIKSNPDDFYIYKEDNEIKWMKYSTFKKKKRNSTGMLSKQPYNSFNNYLLGNGGLQNDVYRKFSSISSVYMGGELLENSSKKELIAQQKQMGIAVDNISTLSKAKRLMKTEGFFKNHQVQFGIGMHAYCLTEETDENGEIKYYLYNPHNQGFPIKFENLDELIKKTTQITIIEI